MTFDFTYKRDVVFVQSLDTYFYLKDYSTSGPCPILVAQKKDTEIWEHRIEKWFGPGIKANVTMSYPFDFYVVSYDCDSFAMFDSGKMILYVVDTEGVVTKQINLSTKFDNFEPAHQLQFVGVTNETQFVFQYLCKDSNNRCRTQIAIFDEKLSNVVWEQDTGLEPVFSAHSAHIDNYIWLCGGKTIMQIDHGTQKILTKTLKYVYDGVTYLKDDTYIGRLWGTRYPPYSFLKIVVNPETLECIETFVKNPTLIFD
jgi:hypothetical protein